LQEKWLLGRKAARSAFVVVAFSPLHKIKNPGASRDFGLGNEESKFDRLDKKSIA
jgi:hypothetical protein